AARAQARGVSQRLRAQRVPLRPRHIRENGLVLVRQTQVLHSAVPFRGLLFSRCAGAEIDTGQGTRAGGVVVRPVRRPFSSTSSTQLSAATTVGKPMVLVSRRIAWRISSGVAPASRARREW